MVFIIGHGWQLSKHTQPFPIARIYCSLSNHVFQAHITNFMAFPGAPPPPPPPVLIASFLFWVSGLTSDTSLLGTHGAIIPLICTYNFHLLSVRIACVQRGEKVPSSFPHSIHYLGTNFSSFLSPLVYWAWCNVTSQLSRETALFLKTFRQWISFNAHRCVPFQCWQKASDASH